ncbi:retinal guanylyl cyclase 2-like [Zootoca vivipara]|uniref:retinal guanylyl cyclase 2-like n=1 Tax=Zootoca vivipara TaxID=8524 RepID=UPI00293B8AD7|nr:retinal guanylyl cyclase 2-like [Zootoca vivipara]
MAISLQSSSCFLPDISRCARLQPCAIPLPCKIAVGLWWAALGLALLPLPIYCAAFNVGLVGPWTCDPFLAKAFPQVAAKLAMERIRKDPSVNSPHQLDCMLCEEGCQTSKALAGFIGYEKYLSAFIGPLNPGYCATASLLGRSWNKAVFSWACISDELDNPSYHPTFVRTLPSPTGILLSVLKYFSWAHVGIVSSQEELWRDTASKLAMALRNRGLPVGVVTSMGRGDGAAEGTWAKIQAAVIILCMHSALIGGEDQAALLTKAQEMGLADGRYIFLPYDTLFYSLPYRNHSYFILENDRSFREAYDAVLTITLQSGEKTFYEAFEAAKRKGEIPLNLEPEQVSPLFGTIYDAIYLVAKALAKAHQQGATEVSGKTLTQHVRNLDFAGFSRRVEADSKGKPLAQYVILDTDGRGSHFFPTYLLVASSGLVQTLGRAMHFPGGSPPPADSSCWFDPDVPCIRGLEPPIVVLVLLPPLTLLLFGMCLAYLIRHSALYRQVIKGPKKLLLTLDDLTFVNTKLSRMRLAVDSLSDSKSNLEGRSLRSATHSLSVKSTTVTYESSNVAIYKGDWVWLKKLESGASSDLRQRTASLLSQMKDVRHENVNPFLGLLSDGGLSAIVTEFCSRGSLEDLLQNADIKLDWMFKSSLLMDLIKGMKYLHHQEIPHGRLKSRNCVVDGRFMLKITDYSYGELLAALSDLDVQPPAEELLWTAPEILRNPAMSPKGTIKGDVYSFAIILQEVVLRGPPYCMSEMSAEEIICKLKKPPPLYRPSVSPENAPLECIQLMKQCWSEGPDRRPSFDEIFQEFKSINKGKRTNIIDSMLRMLEQYSSNLEDLIRERTEELEMEKQKTDKLLSQMLPLSVAETLKTGATVEPEYFDEVTIYFSDIIGFTTISALSEPIEIVDLLNDLYTLFDAIIGHHDVYKVETIGDAYMVASGLPKRNGHRHASEIANMSLDILSSVGSFRAKHLPHVPIRIRMGLHSGPCAAGVVGLTMPRYCLFGDTVNTASRIESTGLPYRIHISRSTMKTLKSLSEGYKVEFRGKTELKGKGLEETYWLVGKKGFTKLLPRPPEVKPGQPWQDTVTQEIKVALRDSKRKSTNKLSKQS